MGITQLDATGKVTYVNPAWVEMTGISGKGALRDSWWKAINPDDQERLESTRNAAISQGQDYSMSYRFVAYGGVIWVDTQARAIKNKIGKHDGSHNAAEVRSLAHVFKGMLANLSANPASAAAARLEELAKEATTDELAGAWQVFERELGGVLLEVEHLLAGALK